MKVAPQFTGGCSGRRLRSCECAPRLSFSRIGASCAGLCRGSCGCLAASSLVGATTAQAQDAIVGTWVGTLKQDEGEPFETRLTFVSPKGGVSRYPASPCGGILAGGPKGDG